MMASMGSAATEWTTAASSISSGQSGGMMVGTKTSYVPGLYMKEKAVEKFREVAEAELRKLPGEVFR